MKSSVAQSSWFRNTPARISSPSKWDFNNGIDNTTKGNVQYVNQNVATQQKLAFVDPSSGYAIVRVDNNTKIEAGSSIHRNSIGTISPRLLVTNLICQFPGVKITSKDAYPIGSLIIIDAIHIPYGCSVQPAFSILGTEMAWPYAGEIDIIEGRNGVGNNSMAMHTGASCSQTSDISQTAQIGKTLDKDCGTAVGRKVEETKANSFGAGFAQAGGAFLPLRSAFPVFFYGFGRGDTPTSISNAIFNTTTDTSGWGQPSAAYPSADCDIERFFRPHPLRAGIQSNSLSTLRHALANASRMQLATEATMERHIEEFRISELL
uniref:Glycoside hydrolase family 16 protein n=1 Tax=Moniliophthora roreri TaxID=221103 RepID=A0A0W0F895_MONRR